MLLFKKGMIFYDLEWTGQELLQIGAVSYNNEDEEEREFERTILTENDIHFKVAETVLLETRLDKNGNRSVYDKRKEKFLKSFTLTDALKDFVDWIQDKYFKYGQIILVSHGSNDIPILFQSLARLDLDRLFLERITELFNFQDYLHQYFPHLPRSLADLVKRIGNKETYFLHSAIEDARALFDVFHQIHFRKDDWTSNTSLVLTNFRRFGFKYEPSQPTTLPFMDIEKDSKFLVQLAKFLNPDGSHKLIVNIEDSWRNGLRSVCSLFTKVMLPRCLMVSVNAWVTRHQLVSDHPGSGDTHPRTVIGLLCQLESVFFLVTYYPDTKSTFMKRKLLLAKDGDPSQLTRGTKVVAKIQLKLGKDPRVMYLLQGNPSIMSLDEALMNLNTTDLYS